MPSAGRRAPWNPLGNTTTYTYDANTTVSNPGNTTTYTYNAEDRSTAANPITQFSSYSYDQHGSDAKTAATTYTYDSGSTPVPDSADTDPADPTRGTTTYQYDSVNRQTSQLDALGHTTRYQYDPGVTGPTSTTGEDALGHVTTYQYDPVNRIISSNDALGGATTTAYDQDGEVTVEFSAPLVTTYTYHADGSLLSSQAPDGTITYSLYDETTGVYKYKYDSVPGPVANDGVLAPGDSYLLKYSYTYYDDAGNPSTGAANMSLALTAIPAPSSLATVLVILPLLLLHRRYA